MLDQLQVLENAKSWEDMCAQFGKYLGLERPVPEPILRRAMMDKKFAYYLLTSRNQPGMLKILFSDPRNKDYEATSEGEERTNFEIISKAARSLVQWGKSGFTQVDQQTYDRRFGACQACPHLVEPPGQWVYKIKLSKKSDGRVCSACGCVASRKARLQTESCPVAHPGDPSMTRWLEPVVARN